MEDDVQLSERENVRFYLHKLLKISNFLATFEEISRICDISLRKMFT